ncbi:hypothetical protein BDW67DRAFT_168190, partial [Aspergillus spinulosporus]
MRGLLHSFLCSWRPRRAYVPLDPSYPEGRIQFISSVGRTSSGFLKGDGICEGFSRVVGRGLRGVMRLGVG